MRKIFSISLTVLIIIAFLVSFKPVMATAQVAPPNGRRFKIGMGINLDWDKLDPENGDSIDINKYLVTLNIGYFITDMFEVGPEIYYSQEEIEDSEMTKWAFVIKGNAHFSTGTQVIPYAGLRAGMSSIDFDGEDDTTFTYGAQLGLDYFIAQNVSVNPELRYTRTTYKINDVDWDSDDISLVIGFGIHF